MEKKSWRKGLGWLLFLEVAIAQPGFAQDEAATIPSSEAAGAPVADSGSVAPGAADGAAEVVDPTSTSASSQESPAADSPEEKSGVKSRLIEEVVVTAQKRSENLQEVPSSVQAFTAGQLDAKGVSDIKDLQLITPGLTFDSMASYSIVFIRGVGGDAFQAGIDSSVATYIDGLYLPFTFSAAQALGDVKQVEVLKGPQGTLYGRNAIAGAIKVELKEPCSTNYCGDFLQQFGNFKDTKTKAGFSGPIPGTDNTVSAGISGLYEQHQAHDQYYLDRDNQDFYQPYRNASYRGVLRWEPSDDFNIQAAYYKLKQQDVDSVITVLLKASPTFTPALTAINKPHVSGNQDNVGANGNTEIATATANLRYFDAFDIKAVYGHVKAKSTILFDYDSAPEPVLDISAVPNTAKSDIAELLFSSNPAATPEWFEWIAGVYYENTLKTGRYPVKVNPIDIALGTPGSAQGFPVCADFTALGIDCDADSNTNQNPFIEVPLRSGVTTDALATYAQFTFHLTEKASLVLGGRASTEKRKLLFSQIDARVIIPDNAILGGIEQTIGLDGLFNGDLPIPILGQGITTRTFTPVSFNKQQHTWNSFTPNIGLNYKVNPDLLVYYRYAEAFKSGNFNGLNVTDPPDRIEPELASSNEVGFKAELFDDRSLKFNAALFTTRVENAQVQNLSLASGGVTSLQNAGAYTVKGAEIEASYFATEALVFSLSAVYLDGQYSKFIGRAFRPETGFSDEQIDFSGNETVRTPKYTATFAVDYNFPLFFGLEGGIGGDIYYNDGFFYDPLNSLTQKQYEIVGARISVFDPGTNIRLTFFGKNLTDDVYFTNKYRQDFGDTGFYGQDLTYGAFVTWSFGS